MVSRERGMIQVFVLPNPAVSLVKLAYATTEEGDRRIEGGG